MPEPCLGTAVCTTVSGRTEGWQTDFKLAGGGVLLNNCYEIIDQIVMNFGILQTVYVLGTNTAADKQQRLYLTEDTAMVTMKFSNTFFLNLLASNTFGERENFLKLQGKDGTIIMTDSAGQKTEAQQYDDATYNRTGEVLANFAMSIAEPETNKLRTGGKDNLRTMAVIESAYLSTRTGYPESPSRILEMQGIVP